jgi:hypothetical protein
LYIIKKEGLQQQNRSYTTFEDKGNIAIISGIGLEAGRKCDRTTRTRNGRLTESD